MLQQMDDLISWFGEIYERRQLIRDFNRSAKAAFISGNAHTYMQSRITRGDSKYKHAFSKFMGGGFRIKALSGRVMSTSELLQVGHIVIKNENLVRKLISLGWDTLEVYQDGGPYAGYKWALKDHANIGGILSNNNQ